MARLQDFPTVTPTSSDKLLVVQSQGQGLVPYGSKLDSANPTGTGSLSLNRASGSTVGANSTAEGLNCIASGNQAHAEGRETTASNTYGHSEGYATKATGDLGSHAEGNTTEARGRNSHAEGQGTIATHRGQHVHGEYNALDASTAVATSRGNYAEIVGNGANDTNRSNARTLDWNGNEVLAGGLKINGNQDVGSKTWELVGTKTAKNSALTYPQTANELFIAFRHKDGYEFVTIIPTVYITATKYFYLGSNVDNVGVFTIEINIGTSRNVKVSIAKLGSTTIADGDFTLSVYQR